MYMYTCIVRLLGATTLAQERNIEINHETNNFTFISTTSKHSWRQKTALQELKGDNYMDDGEGRKLLNTVRFSNGLFVGAQG